MSGYICKTCRLSMRRALRPSLLQSKPPSRALNNDGFLEIDDSRPMGLAPESHPQSSSHEKSNTNKPPPLDIDALLSKPTWSVQSLLPSQNDISTANEITPKKLHHLLRLSALPLPPGRAQEKVMIKTLHTQLHFVRDIQKVNTEGVEPLRSIRDETEEGIKEITIGMDELKDAFAKEDIVGKNRRPRRRRGGVVDAKGVEDWDVTGCATETVEMGGGRYFVVRSGKRGAVEKKKQGGKEATEVLRLVEIEERTDRRPDSATSRSIPLMLDENGVEIENFPEDTDAIESEHKSKS